MRTLLPPIAPLLRVLEGTSKPPASSPTPLPCKVKRHFPLLSHFFLFISLQFSSLHFTSFHFAIFLHCTFVSLRFSSFRFISLHFSSLHFTSLRFSSLYFV